MSFRLLAALAVLAALAAPAVMAQEKIRIAVVDFDTEALHASWSYAWSYADLSRAAADNLVAQLVKSGRFRVIERQQLDKVLAEQNLGESGRLNPQTAAKIGKILGVQLIVIGTVTEFGISETGGRINQIGKWLGGSGVGGKIITGKAGLTARLVDTSTAEILGAYEGSGKHTFGKGEFAGSEFGKEFDSGTTSKVLSEAVKKLAADITNGASGLTPSTPTAALEGKVAKVDGGTIYLNVGSGAGVKVGDIFEIVHAGEKIKDPDTGEVLGGDEQTVGRVKITKVVGEKLSTATSVEGSGFKVGDKAVKK